MSSHHPPPLQTRPGPDLRYMYTLRNRSQILCLTEFFYYFTGKSFLHIVFQRTRHNYPKVGITLANNIPALGKHVFFSRFSVSEADNINNQMLTLEHEVAPRFLQYPTRRRPTGDKTLSQRLRRWPNVLLPVGQCCVCRRLGCPSNVHATGCYIYYGHVRYCYKWVSPRCSVYVFRNQLYM